MIILAITIAIIITGMAFQESAIIIIIIANINWWWGVRGLSLALTKVSPWKQMTEKSTALSNYSMKLFWPNGAWMLLCLRRVRDQQCETYRGGTDESQGRRGRDTDSKKAAET